MKDKKNIGLLIPNLKSGGAERVISSMSKILESEYNVYLFLFDSDEICYAYGGKLVDLKCKAVSGKIYKVLNRIKRIIKLKHYKKKLNLDIVISFLHSANMVNIFSGSRGKKIISCRGYGSYNHNKAKYASSINQIDSIIFQTQRMKSEFIKEFGVSDNKIAVLGNPFDIAHIQTAAKEETTTFSKFKKDRKMLITVGRFKRDKGYWNLIKSFDLICEMFEDVCLGIVGHDGNMEQDIIDMAKKSKFSDRIIFLGYQNNPWKFIDKSDIFLCSSLNEGMPNVVIEALCCGAAVVSTDCKTGPREILSDDKNGTTDTLELCDYGILTRVFNNDIDFDIRNKTKQHTYFADAVLTLLNDENLLAEYKKRALERSADYAPDKFKKALIDILDS